MIFIEKPIGKIGDDLRRIELSEENGGKSAKTHIKVLERNYEKYYFSWGKAIYW